MLSTPAPRAQRIVLIASLFAIALAIRLPYLHLIPRFEDEVLEVLSALEIFQGTSFPLTGGGVYYGPLFSYMVAGLFHVLGVDVIWPRLMIAVFGALTVLATYWLGRVIANEQVGLIAALFALANPALTLISSHQGWSNSLTPFFATVTLALTYVGVTQHRAALVGIGGFMAGLTLQTHPLAVTLLVALAAWFLFVCPPREWFRRKDPYIALAACGVAYAPMVWMLVTHWTETTHAVQQQGYSYAPTLAAGPYAERLLHMVARVLVVMPGVDDEAFRYVRVPIVVLLFLLFAVKWTLIVAGGKAVSSNQVAPVNARAGTLPIFAVLIPIVLFPFITRSFYTRYLTFLVPIVCVCMGYGLARLWDLGLSRGWLSHAPRVTRRFSRAIVIAVLMLIPLTDILLVRQILVHAVHQGTTNAAFFELRETISTLNACNDGVFIENTDYLEVPGEAKGWVYFNMNAVRYVLILDSCGMTMEPAADLLALLSTRSRPAWIVIPEQSVSVFSRILDLTPVMAIAPGPPVPAEFRLTLFRAERTN